MKKLYALGLVLVAALILAVGCVGEPRSAPRSVALPGSSLFKASDPLPLAPELTKKVLPNGLTYYVRANGNPGGRVTMFLVVAGGSSVEEENELGYAHFVEHMAFNGTASFPENELVRYLRSIGMEFGAEINAYTSIENTVYTLEMPTDNPAFFDTGLKVLREWATAISFDPVEVEKEKGVILEERRLGLGPSEAARKAELPVLLAGSKQATREPIGTEASIRNATAEGLKAFYERNYRADRIAVMIVGDIDRTEAAAAVEREFSFPNPDGQIRERPFFPVKPSFDLSFVATYHPDFDRSVLFYQKLVALKDERTIGDYVEWLKKRIAVEAVKLRLSDLTRAGGKAWAEAYFDDDYFYGLTRIYMFSLLAETGEELKAFNDLAIEVERVRRHGFTESEFRRTVDNWRRWLSTLDVEDQDLKSWSFAEEYVRNFMYNEPVPGVINERVYIKDTLDKLSLDDLNAAARSILAEDEGAVAMRAKSAPADAAINARSFEAALESARASALGPLELSNAFNGGLFDDEPQGGSIVAEKEEAGGITVLTLGNGATVLLKPTTFDRDSIDFVAWSQGGYSALPPEDYYAAVFGPTLLSAAGLGGMDATRLQEETALANIALSWTISENSESFTGKAATSELRTLLRLVYLNAAEQGRDTAAFNLMRERLAAQVGPLLQDPGYRFDTAWNAHLFSGNPRYRALNPVEIRALSYERVRAVSEKALAAASDFSYVLVGDFDLDEAKKLAARYLGAIPAGKASEKQGGEPLRSREDGGVRIDYALSKEKRASVRMVWAGEAPWSWERENALDLMAQALNNRLLDAIREDLGGTYVTSTRAVYTRFPLEQYLFIVSFDCDPERVEELIAEVRDEAAMLAAGDMPAMYAQQIRAAAQRDYTGTTRTNGFWVRSIANALANGLNYDIAERARQRPALADADLFRLLAADTLKPERSFVYVMLPEK
jgi:zinc protease